MVPCKFLPPTGARNTISTGLVGWLVASLYSVAMARAAVPGVTRQVASCIVSWEGIRPVRYTRYTHMGATTAVPPASLVDIEAQRGLFDTLRCVLLEPGVIALCAAEDSFWYTGFSHCICQAERDLLHQLLGIPRQWAIIIADKARGRISQIFAGCFNFYPTFSSCIHFGIVGAQKPFRMDKVHQLCDWMPQASWMRHYEIDSNVCHKRLSFRCWLIRRDITPGKVFVSATMLHNMTAMGMQCISHELSLTRVAGLRLDGGVRIADLGNATSSWSDTMGGPMHGHAMPVGAGAAWVWTSHEPPGSGLLGYARDTDTFSTPVEEPRPVGSAPGRVVCDCDHGYGHPGCQALEARF